MVIDRSELKPKTALAALSGSVSWQIRKVGTGGKPRILGQDTRARAHAKDGLFAEEACGIEGQGMKFAELPQDTIWAKTYKIWVGKLAVSSHQSAPDHLFSKTMRFRPGGGCRRGAPAQARIDKRSSLLSLSLSLILLLLSLSLLLLSLLLLLLSLLSSLSSSSSLLLLLVVVVVVVVVVVAAVVLLPAEAKRHHAAGERAGTPPSSPARRCFPGRRQGTPSSTLAYKHTNRCAQTCIHAHMHTCTYAYAHTCIRARMETTHTHTHTHTEAPYAADMSILRDQVKELDAAQVRDDAPGARATRAHHRLLRALHSMKHRSVPKEKCTQCLSLWGPPSLQDASTPDQVLYRNGMCYVQDPVTPDLRSQNPTN